LLLFALLLLLLFDAIMMNTFNVDAIEIVFGALIH